MEGDTTFTQRTKELASHPNTRRAAAAGGVSTATMMLVYQLFVPTSLYNRHLDEEKTRQSDEKDRRAAVWRVV